LTGNRREAVLDASLGLGEAVVSGEVNPDHFVVDRRTGAVLERRLGDKRVAIRQLEGGGTRREEREGADSSACMTDDLIRALVQLGSTVEGVFGAPQDIEFALDGEGTLWLTQARPITTLYPLPSGPIPEDRHVYFSLNVFQGMLQPFTPMGVQGMRLTLASLMAAAGFPFADPVAGPPFLVEAGMRVFGDLTPVLRHPFGRRMLLRVMPHMEARSVPIVEHLLAEDPELKPVPASRATTFRRLAGVMARTRLPFRILGALWNPGKAVARATARLRRPPQPSSGRDPLERVQAILFGIAEGFLVVAPVAIAGAIAWGVAEALLSDLATAEELDTARRALPNNPTTEMDLALWQLAQHAQEDAASVEALDSLEPAELEARFRAGRLPGPLQEGLTRFLEAYGQRGLAEIDLGAPRWADEPAYLFGVIRGYGRMRDPELAPDRVFRRAETEADAMVETLTQRAARGNPLRGRLVRFLLGRMRAMFGLREGHKFILVTGLAQARTHLAQVGRELAGQGALEAAEDIFFLDLREVRLAREGRPVRDLVRQRRADYATELQRRQVPRILLSDGTVPVAGPTPSQDQDGLSGAPASAGTVTGRAHVVLDPRNAGLEAGQILVAPSTDPAWTPLFLSAAGLVMEMGGAMSHGAVVAREYGIPAVVGVPQATERIPDGALIEVDGTSGRVRLLGSEP